MTERATQRPDESTKQGDSGLLEGWVRTTLGEIHVDQSGLVDPTTELEQWFELYSVPSWDTAEPEILKGEEIGSNKLRVHRNAVLLCKINPRINRTWIVGDHSPWPKIASTEWIPFYPVKGIYQPYLAYYMQQSSFRDFLSMHASGVGGSLMRVKPSTFADYPFLVAPFPEQCRIVKAIETQFTRLQAAVTALKRAQANLERYRASVLQAACEGRLVPTEAELACREGRDYEPADELLERILEERRTRWEEERWQYEIERAKKKAAQAERKAAGLPYYIRELEPEHWEHRVAEEYEPYLPKNDKWTERYDEPEPPDMEDLPELPEGWVWTSMEQIGNILGGLTKNSKRKEYPLRLPYLRVANVYADELRLDDIKEIGVKESELERVLLEKRDLLVVEGNGSIDQIGRVAIWNGAIEPCVHQNHLIKVRLVLPEMAQYVLAWLLSAGGRERIVDVASSTSGLYTLSLSKVSRLPVPLPPLREQRRIVEEVERRLSVVEALERSVEADLARAERLRQAILKKAFEGRLVPQDPNDEPASVLLERIQNDPGKGEDTTPQQMPLL